MTWVCLVEASRLLWGSWVLCYSQDLLCRFCLDSFHDKTVFADDYYAFWMGFDDNGAGGYFVDISVVTTMMQLDNETTSCLVSFG